MLKRISTANKLAQLRRRKIVGQSSRSSNNGLLEGELAPLSSTQNPQPSLEHQNQPQLQPQVDHSSPNDSTMNTDEVDEVNNGENQRKTRGPTRLARIWNLVPGDELPEKFNCYNQCVDNGELETFCGTVARNPALTPLEYSNWRKVPLEKKDELWTVVKSKFDLSPRRRSWVLRQISKCLREFKHTLYNENFFKYRTLAELKANVNSRTTKDQWIALASKWYSKEWQAKSEKGKAIRSRMKLPHTSGTISLAKRAEMEFKKTGKRPNRTQLFVKYHKGKDGKPVTPEAAALLEKIEEYEKTHASNGEDGQNGDGSFVPLDKDTLSLAIGPENKGRVLGMGFGVTPKTFTSTNLDVLRADEKAKEREKVLEEQVTTLNSKVDKLQEVIAKFLESNNSGFQQDHNNEGATQNNNCSNMLAMSNGTTPSSAGDV